MDQDLYMHLLNALLLMSTAEVNQLRDHCNTTMGRKCAYHELDAALTTIATIRALELDIQVANDRLDNLRNGRTAPRY